MKILMIVVVAAVLSTMPAAFAAEKGKYCGMKHRH